MNRSAIQFDEQASDVRSTHHANKHFGTSGTPPTRDRTGGSLRRRLLARVLKTLGQPALSIELPNGECIDPEPSSAPIVGRVRIVDNAALWRLITDPLFQFPEMYCAQRVEIDGPIDRVTQEIFRAMARAGHRSTILMRLMSWVRWPRRTTLRAAKQNIHHHYDIGNDFYALWLDAHMAYTCAYFPRPEATLEEAQLAKFEHVCKKLRLQPQMSVIEAGCGWGGLALHMAKHYGVRVSAYNISHQQIQFARQRARDEGLADRVDFVEADWRMIRGRFDVFVSVGMLEHVGSRHYRQLGEIIDRALKPGGWGLIHSIGQNFAAPAGPWIERRIFPGGYPPALSEMLAIFEPNGFSILDVENIRLHYAQTLTHWLTRFQQHEPQVLAMFDEKFVRMWRFYLAGSLAAFDTGSYQLFQVVFNRAADNSLPRTREYIYQRVEPALFEPAAKHPSSDPTTDGR